MNALHLCLSTLTASMNNTAGGSVPTDSMLTKNQYKLIIIAQENFLSHKIIRN